MEATAAVTWAAALMAVGAAEAEKRAEAGLVEETKEASRVAPAVKTAVAREGEAPKAETAAAAGGRTKTNLSTRWS